MHPKGTWVCKSNTTLVTCIGLLACVCTQVSQEATLLYESTSTCVTSIRLLPCMCAYMSLKVTQLGESNSTLVTYIRPLPRVCMQVYPEVQGTRIMFGTLWPSTLPPPGFSLCSHRMPLLHRHRFGTTQNGRTKIRSLIVASSELLDVSELVVGLVGHFRNVLPAIHRPWQGVVLDGGHLSVQLIKVIIGIIHFRFHPGWPGWPGLGALPFPCGTI